MLLQFEPSPPSDGTDFIRLATKNTVPESPLQESPSLEKRSLSRVSQRRNTFREADKVFRWFKYHHIWIESLCIQQGSVEDWRRLTQKMKLVYRNANITIAAGHGDST
ncbi:hypothetical protein PG994_006020 [Apiospora phragmitis]|uniref:Heterokaryon incompatibility domain-containing protein n=1 Tax=Apiospora phragmitis TaxID=2905665 RepID=A0ABR1VDW7_9PEZI